ncbi:sensor histidine kinase [Pelagicoccus sp. SDUM812005]|uniref:sensor histidine kinase n=1 Tax=Pelagicoccus sp. SDUM812005 TaxID=3041257 RepID=UPI00280DF99B|nr:sensor histidine kinase [Pelagicoccus sp. SDUM812005]MDQ8179249.1 sensor histidine kinase [Pelagicoccus sp. SDUM812005]
MIPFSTRYRWAWLVCLLLLIGFLTNSLSSYFVSKRNVRRTIVETSLPLTSDNVYSEIQRDLLRPIFISSLMANDTFLKDWSLEGESKQDAVTKYLHELKIQYNTISSFFVSEKTRTYYHPQGILKKIREDDPRDEWYFRVRDLPEDYEINVDPDLANQDEMTIFINYRVKDYQGNFIGATGVGLTVNRVNHLISRYEAKYDRQIYFVNTDGKMVLRPSNSPLLNIPSLQEIEGLAEQSSALLNGEIANLSYERDGKTRLLNCRFVPELDWFLIVEQTEDAQLAPLRKELLINVIIALLTTAVVAWIFIVSIKRHHDRLERRNQELSRINDQIERQKKKIEQSAASLEKANDELSRLNREKDEFIGIVAHDLRNPLNGILGLCAVTDFDEDDPVEFIQDIEDSANRMLSLVETLLDVSRIEGHDVQVSSQHVNPFELVKNSCAQFTEHADRKNIKLSIEGDTKSELRIFTDPDWFSICLNNLINNAVKYTPEYGKVQVKTYAETGSNCIAISDTGPGISEEDQRKLFGKFARLSAKPTGGESSTGLGLYLVKSMCERLGIEITVRSVLGKGTTFTLKVPSKSEV